jgi:DNA-binding LacI/PurR family transcriptional regulator
MPFVLIDRYFPDLDCDYVVSDNFGGAYRATEHLIILGHIRIAFSHTAFGTPVTTSVRSRLQGYQQALETYGLPYDESLIAVYDDADGSDNPYHELLARPNRPTAIFTTIPDLIHPIMATANNLGLQIPDDLALVTFDDLQFAPYLNPPLTTIAQSCQKMGEQAASLLIRRIRGQRGPTDQINIPTKLIVRESCGAKVRVRAQISANI